MATIHDYFQIQKTADFFNEKDREAFYAKGMMGGPISMERYPHSFRSYDDDMVFYFDGVVEGSEVAKESLFEWAQMDSGVTEIVFYDRKTKKVIDTFC